MSNPAETRRTPLYDSHVELGARMAPFAGFEMPIQYSGIIDEHLSVRRAAGLFDVSHMGEIRVSGPASFAFVQHLVTNDAEKLYDGRVMYSVMCRENGGIVDDLLVYRLAEDDYMLVVNAANLSKDVLWMRENNPMGASINDVSEATALIALQGPASVSILESVTDVPVSALQYYHAIAPQPGEFLGCSDIVISATGYTGETGFEIYCRNADATSIWAQLIDAGRPRGLKPAGLGARDTLRLEAGYCLYGNDIDETTTPLEAGLGWVTKLTKPAFIGKDALVLQHASGVRRRLVTFVMDERGIPRHGYGLLDTDGKRIGEVTSGTQSPILESGIGMGYVENDSRYTAPDARIAVHIRNKATRARIKKAPLHRQT